MANLKHIINLSKAEREELQNIIEDSKSSARHIKRAQILLASDMGQGKRMTVEKMLTAFDTTRQTINLTRQNYLSFGLEGAIKGKKKNRPSIPVKVTDKVEAEIIHLLWSPPPSGKRRWTIRLLAQKAMEEGILESISRTKINQILKKHGLDTKY